jgi:hypothetical protein
MYESSSGIQIWDLEKKYSKQMMNLDLNLLKVPWYITYVNISDLSMSLVRHENNSACHYDIQT